MHQIESIQKDETNKILFDFETQMHHQIPDRRPDFMIINKKRELAI